VADALREKKILIKTFGNEFLKKYVRISTGSKKAMGYFLDAFLEVDK
jgi:histidinol-phosphate aminotransferase